MARLIWSARAVVELEQICEFIGRTSEQNAEAFARQAVALIESIPDGLRLGAIVPEYDREAVRELLLHNDRIIYRIRGEDAEVVRIIHGSRSLPPKL